jgi:hypothetical protein
MEFFLRAHQCPKCDLRFATRNELEDHLAVDHDHEPSWGPSDSVHGAA